MAGDDGNINLDMRFAASWDVWNDYLLLKPFFPRMNYLLPHNIKLKNYNVVIVLNLKTTVKSASQLAYHSYNANSLLIIIAVLVNCYHLKCTSMIYDFFSILCSWQFMCVCLCTSQSRETVWYSMTEMRVKLGLLLWKFSSNPLSTTVT